MESTIMGTGLLGHGNVLKLIYSCGYGNSGICKTTNWYTFKWVNFVVYESYFNKVRYKETVR